MVTTLKTKFPEEALSNHIAILGKTGSGKTTAAKGLAESLMDAGRRICAVDPTGAWYGLRLLADGKTPAFPVVIFGGDNADVEIDENSAVKLATIIAAGTFSSIIDTSLMTVGARTRLFTEFAEALFRANRVPLHLIIDEAHLFAPQGRVPDPQSGRMVHAANNLVSGGRSRGLRIILISQRPAKLHKDSLTQVETLVAMRLIAPQDRAAVEAWIGEWDDGKQGKELISSLPSLPRGDAWVWAPELGILDRMTFPMIRTLDSSRTPEHGEEISAPAILSDVEIGAIREALAPEEEEVSAPKKERIPQALIDEAEKRGFDRGYSEGRQSGFDDAKSAMQSMVGDLELPEESEPTGTDDDAIPAETVKQFRSALPPGTDEQFMATVTEKAVRRDTAGKGDKMGRAERKILTVLAQYPQGRTKIQIAVVAGYAHSGGGFNNALGWLTTRGYIERTSDFAKITAAGRSALGSYERLPVGAELLRYWLGSSTLGKAERSILEALARAKGRPISKENLARTANYEPTGGGFNNALGKLRTLELISGSKELRASEELL